MTAEGRAMLFDGAVSYGGENQLGWGALTPGGVVHEPAAQNVSFDWLLSDFALGGVRALAAGDAYTAHQGGLHS